MAVSKLCRTCGQTLLPVIMFNYYSCLYDNVCERNGNKTCLIVNETIFDPNS